MAQLYTAGETKIRPGVYYRYSKRGGGEPAGALSGVNAIVINAPWGPVGTVTVHETANSISETYGNTGGAEVAKILKAAGATRVYICRPEGSGGKEGSVEAGSGTLTAKYVGERALAVKIQEKPGDATKKEAIVLDGTTQLEKFTFAAGDAQEGNNLKAALDGSNYVKYTVTESAVVPVNEYKLTGGVNPTLTAQDYLKGFQALEPYRFNVLTTDSIEDGVAEILKTYVAEAKKVGKFMFGVIGAPTSVDFATRLAAAKACNDESIVYMGSAVTMGDEVYNGVKAINYAAGVIAATPSNQSIVHTVISGATDIPEKLTNAQYEEAIQNGMLALSMSPNGEVWFDSGVTTLTEPAANQDDGWKKIKRVSVRHELIDRIDRVVAPLIGKINCDADGVAAVIQAGMGVITSMIAEQKLVPTTTMVEDPDYPHQGDSAWFLIQADDIDALEKIYTHYMFRYSQEA